MRLYPAEHVVAPCGEHLLQWAAIPLPDGLSLQEIYTRLPLQQPGIVLLDSATEPSPAGKFPLARYCIVAQEPFGILEGTEDGAWWHSSDEGSQFVAGNPLRLLQTFLNRYSLPAANYLTPLPAGAIGFLNYGLKALIESCPNRLPAPNRLPLYWFGFYDAIAAIDLYRREMILTSTGFPHQGAAQLRRAQERLQQLVTQWQSLLNTPAPPVAPAYHCGETQVYWSRREYAQAHRRIQRYIAAGDVYQVNLAQMFQACFEGSPAGLFLRARAISPVPFGAYLQAEDFTIISLSPERFLHVCPITRRVQTRPIKGTRPRATDMSEDRRYACELLHSHKDRAEHIMIVDLERNDLGRVAQVGTVEVAELMTLEGFAQMYHLTSTVQATLRPEVDAATLLWATFPGGSITGAPKVRAMQIIEEVEPVAREVYTGSLGYIGFHGGIDMNIAIRTAVVRDKKITFYAGGGIVADSNADEEYAETLIKAMGWFEAIRASQGEHVYGTVGMVQRSPVR
ncbi:MAG: aminodeoxychorismate synthase, component I [Armatimonadota bacterium]|nr:MAG: aminodeoxychorismate synthase, component I [Armatimonadota bacterium]